MAYLRLSRCAWPLRNHRVSSGSESDARVRTVTERLVGAPAAATKARRCDARDHAASTAGDLEIAADLQGTIGLWIDSERAVANGEHVGVARRRFTACAESYVAVRAVAERLILRRAAAAKRHSIPAGLAGETDIAAHGVGSRFADRDQIDGRWGFAGPAVL